MPLLEERPAPTPAEQMPSPAGQPVALRPPANAPGAAARDGEDDQNSSSYSDDSETDAVMPTGAPAPTAPATQPAATDAP